MAKKKVKAAPKPITNKDEKMKALDLALTQIKRTYGQGAIMKMSETAKVDINSMISTGSLALDAGLGVFGVPRGRVVEIFGPEGSGKTTLALHIVAQAQKNDGVVAFIDVEHALNPSYAETLGIKVDELLISQPDTGEQALDIMEQLVRSNAVDCIVLDSVAALAPKAEIEGEMGDSHMALQARLMSQAMRKLTAIASRSKTCLLFINQIREKVGVFFGSGETTPGGRALKFYSSMRMDVRAGPQIKIGNDKIGHDLIIKVVKNKMAPPFKIIHVDLIYGQGISREGEILDLGMEMKLVEKSGAWFTSGEHKLGQGREKAKVFLQENPEIRDELERQIRENLMDVDEAEPHDEPEKLDNDGPADGVESMAADNNEEFEF